MNQLLVKVTKKTHEAVDIATFELSAVDGARLPPFSAGSHIDVEVRADLVRQYSLCNDPSEQHRYLIGVLREPQSRGGSIGMHDDIKEGDIVRISEPKNHFPLSRAERTLLFAGGIGITPILCMAERLAQLGDDFALHYCARSAERAAFRGRIAESGFADRVQFHFDDGDVDQRLDLAMLLAAPGHDTHIYVCGPGGFIDYVVQTAKLHGWSLERIHLEYFAAPVADASANVDFNVQLASTGKIYSVPADKTIVDVLRENGIEILVSCEQGVCGTCVTRVLDGEPDHRDVYLTDAEHARNDQLTPCCSRSKSRTLVLDL
jgi:vanillate O-demethylase ferredoxin subunit